MNTKQQIVAAAFLALISTATVRADGTSGYMPSQGFTPQSSAPTFSPSDVTWKNVMSGSVVPLSIKGRDLNASWRSFTTNEGSADISNLVMRSYGLTGSTLFFSEGDVISVAGENYLVAYRQKKAPVDLEAMSSSRYDVEKQIKDMAFSPNSTLQLSLLNVHLVNAVNQMEPFDVSIFNDKEIDDTVAKKNLNDSSNSNLKQLMLGVMQYAQDYDEKFPPMQSMYVLKKAVYPYVKSEQIFLQPSNKKFYVPNAALSKMSMARLQLPAKFAAIYEADFGSDGKRGVGFADGHVKRVTPAEWAQIKKDSGIK